MPDATLGADVDLAQPRLPRSFYARPAIELAPDLLGCRVVHVDPDSGVVRAARIVETEAYAGVEDKACHASKGRTARTEVMFGEPGHAYLFLIYGMHWCFNVVCDRAGVGAAVLVRAATEVQDCDGHLSGPGAFCRALHLDGRRYGADLTGDELHLLAPDQLPERIVTGPRVNVDYAGEWAGRPWRFAIDQEPAVSRPRPFALPRTRAKRRP